MVRRHRINAARDLQHVARARPRRAFALSLTTISAPTRSRYSPKFLENDTAISASGRRCATMRTAGGVVVQRCGRSPDTRDRGTERAGGAAAVRPPPAIAQVEDRRRLDCGSRHESDTTSPAARAVELLEHRLEAQRMSARIVVRIALEPSPELPSSGEWLPQVGSLTCTAAPGAAARINSAPTRRAPHPPGVCTVRRAPVAASGVRRAEHQFLHGAVEFLAARGTHVGLGGLRRQDLLFRPADAVAEPAYCRSRSRYTPTPRSTFFGAGSARYFAISPRIESALKRSSC